MENIYYIEPSGDTISEPTASEVVEFMRLEDDEYWGPYSPVGQLHSRNSPSHSLIFIRHPHRGWYLEYEVYRDPQQHFVAIEPTGDKDKWIEHWAFGETAFFLVACFVPQSVAEQVVTDFMDSRQPSPVTNWELFNYLVHRREDAPDDESAVVEFADPEG